MKKKKVVTLGAGTGQAVLLTALREFGYSLDVTAIVSVSDNGGHSGLLREMYHIPQVGDGRQCLLALAPSGRCKTLYEQRSGDGLSVGNERLAELTLKNRTIANAFELFGCEVGARGRVLPVTTERVNIAARLENGQKIVGEWQIIERQPRNPISELYLEPGVEAYYDSLCAIQEADYIIVSPGSLRTGIISCLLTNGIHQAVRSTSAILIFTVNLMTHPGQTDGFSVQDHLDEFARYAGRYPDYAIVNNGLLSPILLDHYAAIGSKPVVGSVTVPVVGVVTGDFMPENNNHRLRQERVGDFKKWTHALVHDGNKLATSIKSLMEIG